MGKVLLRTFGDKTFPTCRQFAYDKLIGAPSNFLKSYVTLFTENYITKVLNCVMNTSWII